jgi:transcriptional regulator GlxA family with amidase domain
MAENVLEMSPASSGYAYDLQPMSQLISQRRIAIFAFDDIEALDLIGPAETFAKVRIDGHPAYSVRFVGLRTGEVTAESGVVFQVSAKLHAAVGCDTLIIPGGRGVREKDAGKAIARWLRTYHDTIRRVASVCTGAYALAASGLVEGRRVATHWNFVADLARRFPTLRVDAHSLHVRDGKYYSSAGVLAGIDLTLALIEEDHGTRASMEVAREMVCYMKRPGQQAQHSIPLQCQLRAPQSMSDLVTWISTHLQADLSVAALAARAHLSVRQFRRRFIAELGIAPAAHVQSLRLEAARGLLQKKSDFDKVARAVGLANSSALRRLLRRQRRIVAWTPTNRDIPETLRHEL